jgi:Phosphatidylinositol 3- and 4-kinase
MNIYADAEADILRVLQTGNMEIEGVLPWSSNYAFLATVCEDDLEVPAVYKPRRGERPLWDFPQGTLSLREQAAYVVSKSLGWNLVPPTVLRNGAHGPGSVQLFVPHDPQQHYFSLEGEPLYRAPLQKMVLMDYVINNADRKGGHIIIEEARSDGGFSLAPDQLWGIDHGICFHADHKLRTVIWEFAGAKIPSELLANLRNFREALGRRNGELRTQLNALLSGKEIAALESRSERLIRSGEFPKPGPGRHYPWPPI